MTAMIYRPSRNSLTQRIAAVTTLVLLLLLGLIAIIYLASIYNGLVTLRENLTTAWANIDVLLKQRHDELPRLIETCRQYMTFEQETLDRVMRARACIGAATAAGDVTGVGAAEQQMRSGIARLFAVAESYPDLKSDQNFKQLQARITALEEAIADRREFYNDQANLNNIRVKTFPDSVIADRFGFRRAALLEFAKFETADIDVAGLFRA